MVTTQKRLRRSVIGMSVTAALCASFGAVVIAAPFVVAPRSQITEVASLSPLASGPAIQLARAGDGASEDCVRITRVTGPDGKEYPTNGIVCSGN
jgi:hypothetical protein